MPILKAISVFLYQNTQKSLPQISSIGYVECTHGVEVPHHPAGPLFRVGKVNTVLSNLGVLIMKIMLIFFG